MTRVVEVTVRSQRQGSHFHDVILMFQLFLCSSERISDVLAVLIPASAKNWTIAVFVIVQGYGKYQAL